MFGARVSDSANRYRQQISSAYRTSANTERRRLRRFGDGVRGHDDFADATGADTIDQAVDRQLIRPDAVQRRDPS